MRLEACSGADSVLAQPHQPFDGALGAHEPGDVRDQNRQLHVDLCAEAQHEHDRSDGHCLAIGQLHRVGNRGHEADGEEQPRHCRQRGHRPRLAQADPFELVEQRATALHQDSAQAEDADLFGWRWLGREVLQVTQQAVGFRL